MDIAALRYRGNRAEEKHEAHVVCDAKAEGFARGGHYITGADKAHSPHRQNNDVEEDRCDGQQ